MCDDRSTSRHLFLAHLEAQDTFKSSGLVLRGRNILHYRITPRPRLMEALPDTYDATSGPGCLIWRQKGEWKTPCERLCGRLCGRWPQGFCSHIPLAGDQLHLVAREAGRCDLTGPPGRRRHWIMWATSHLCHTPLLPVLWVVDSPVSQGLWQC